MKTIILSKTKSLFVYFLLATSFTFAQTIITIDNNSGSTTTYQTIQAAHDAATAGDIIYVQPSGTSYGAVTIDKALTIVGRSHSEPSKASQLGAIIIRSSSVTLKGLKFSSLYPQSSGAPIAPPFVGLNVFECETSSLQFGEGNVAPTVIMDDVAIRGNNIESTVTIYEDATDVLISNNIFSGGSGINFYNTTSAVVANNIFRNYYQFTSSITFYNYSTSGTAILYNNMFISNSGSDFTVNFNSGDFNLSNNLTYNYGVGDVLLASTGGTLTDTNTLANTDPLFTNVDTASTGSFVGLGAYDPAFRLEDDLTLQAGSPALTGGGGGSEMGLHNNGFLYKTIGNPRGIPTLDVVSYDGAVPKNGNINVTINAKAH